MICTEKPETLKHTNFHTDHEPVEKHHTQSTASRSDIDNHKYAQAMPMGIGN
jgi:hypothetical protein